VDFEGEANQSPPGLRPTRPSYDNDEEGQHSKQLLKGREQAMAYARSKQATDSGPVTAALHHGPASKRRQAAIRKGYRTKLQTTFNSGEWRTTVWIRTDDSPGWDYVAVWRNGKAEFAYRVVRGSGYATPTPIGFDELP